MVIHRTSVRFAAGLLVLCCALLPILILSSATSSAAPRSPGQPALAPQAYLPYIARHAESIPTPVPGPCAAIQQAIDGLPPSGGLVLVGTGTFTCTTALIIDRDSVDLRGQGPSTILRLANGANSPVLVIGQTQTPATITRTHIHVSDLMIDGNRDHQAFECWGGPCDTGGLTFLRNNGITVRHVADAVIERVSVSRARSGGLVAEKGCRRLTIRDLTSFDNFYDGFAAYETEESVFGNLYLHNNPYAGMSLDIRFNHNIINNSVMADNGKQGIFMRDSRDNVFTGLQILNSGEQGVFMAQVDTDASRPAAGNTFVGMVVSGSVSAGLRVNDASCVNNLVTSSQFIGNQGGCISEAAPNLAQVYGTICR